MSRPKRNIAASVGRWSARHRKIAVIGWITFVILAFFVGGKVGTQQLTQKQSGVGDSGHAERILENAYPDKAHEAVLFQSSKYTADDPEFRTAVRDVAASPARRPRRPENRGPVRQDQQQRHQRQPALGAARVRDPGRRREGQGRHDDRRQGACSGEGGRRGVVADPHRGVRRRVEQHGLRQARPGRPEEGRACFSLPLTLIVLLLTFGTLLAAGVPLLLALTGVLATFGLIGPSARSLPSRSRSRTSCCSSAWPWASTTPCSTCEGCGRNEQPDATISRRSTPRPRPRAAPCSSPASRSWSPWQGCTWPAPRRSPPGPPARSWSSRSR